MDEATTTPEQRQVTATYSIGEEHSSLETEEQISELIRSNAPAGFHVTNVELSSETE